MEFDNDRLIKPTTGIELFFRTVLWLATPLISSITFFSSDWRMWPVLLIVSLATLPAYLLYARISVPMFLLRRRRVVFALISLFSFLVILSFLFAAYLLILKFPLSATAKAYFTFSSTTIIRESFWVILNMSLGVAIFYIRLWFDERDMLSVAQKSNNFFKLRYLRAQLNPHFLFNTLNSIYSLSMQKSDRAPEVVVRLADVMRYLIYECNEEKIPLNKEIAFIRNYVEIEKIRHKADIRFTIEGETDDIMIEPFLFISFIENGFKHAMDNSFDEPFIYITLRVGKGNLLLTVVNSSNADLEMQAKKINGKGLTTSKSLLEMLYPDSHVLDIIQTEKEETRTSDLRLRNAKERLESLYPDSYTLDVILNKNSFAVSLFIKPRVA